MQKYLLQASQQHFIADHKNTVQGGEQELFYPMVLNTSKHRMYCNDLIYVRIKAITNQNCAKK